MSTFHPLFLSLLPEHFSRQEAEIHFAMRHANIVEVVAFGLGDADHPPCLVMERMEESLYDLLGVEGMEMDAASKLGIVSGICEVRSQKKGATHQ